MKTIPCGWYYAGKSLEFTHKVKAFQISDLKLLIYRSHQGQLVATQSHCPHMNADLSKGKVTQSGLTCPLHKWHFTHEGQCNSIPGLEKEKIPTYACLKTYPVFEHSGHVFIHTSAHSQGITHKIPFFENENLADYQISRPYTLLGNNHWSVAAANAFDLAHFEHVHFRKPSQTILSDFSQKDFCRLKIAYEIKGKNLADRWLVKNYGAQASLDYTVYNGQLIVAKTSIGNFRNRMMVFVEPNNNQFKATLFVFTPKSHSPIAKIKNEISAYFSYRFFQKECIELSGVKIDPARLAEHEVLLKQYFEWLGPQIPQRNESSSDNFATIN